MTFSHACTSPRPRKRDDRRDSDGYGKRPSINQELVVATQASYAVFRARKLRRCSSVVPAMTRLCHRERAFAPD